MNVGKRGLLAVLLLILLGFVPAVAAKPGGSTFEELPLGRPGLEAAAFASLGVPLV